MDAAFACCKVFHTSLVLRSDSAEVPSKTSRVKNPLGSIFCANTQLAPNISAAEQASIPSTSIIGPVDDCTFAIRNCCFKRLRLIPAKTCPSCSCLLYTFTTLIARKASSSLASITAQLRSDLVIARFIFLPSLASSPNASGALHRKMSVRLKSINIAMASVPKALAGSLIALPRSTFSPLAIAEVSRISLLTVSLGPSFAKKATGSSILCSNASCLRLASEVNTTLLAV